MEHLKSVRKPIVSMVKSTSRRRVGKNLKDMRDGVIGAQKLLRALPETLNKELGVECKSHFSHWITRQLVARTCTMIVRNKVVLKRRYRFLANSPSHVIERFFVTRLIHHKEVCYCFRQVQEICKLDADEFAEWCHEDDVDSGVIPFAAKICPYTDTGDRDYDMLPTAIKIALPYDVWVQEFKNTGTKRAEKNVRYRLNKKLRQRSE